MKIGTDGVILGAWADCSGVRSVIDVGAGSGLIALMIAQRNADAKITAVEIEPNACEDAKTNVEASPWADRVEVVNADILTANLSPEPPLLIISNPPFFTEQLHSPSPERALARHGEDFGPMELIAWSASIMKEGDTLAFIVPSELHPKVDFQLSLNRLATVRLAHLYSAKGARPIRNLYQVTPETPSLPPCEEENLRIGSDPYHQLTSPFYLDK